MAAFAALARWRPPALALLAKEECGTVGVYYVERTLNESCCARGTPYSYFSRNASLDARCCSVSRKLNDEYAAWKAFGKLRAVKLILV